MVKGGASPDDPELAGYWAERRRKVEPPLDGYTLRLLAKQNALCPFCGDPLLSAEQPPESPGQWERWWLHLARKAISAGHLGHHGRPGSRPDDDHTRLVHASCRRGHRACNAGASTARPNSPQRLA
jgi:RNA-directed DNA polymerase